MSHSPLAEPPVQPAPSDIGALLPTALPPVQCRNCGTGLTGPYCAECGQRDGPVDPSLRELVADAWDAFVSVDGKVLSSLRLLVLRPGALTVDYLSGRRARHLTPLRVYLLCSVGYFLVTSLVPDKPDHGPAAAFNVGSDTVRLAEGSKAHHGESLAEQATERARKDSTRRAALARHRIPLVAGVLDSTTRAMADSVRLEEQVAEWKGTPQWMRARLVHGVSALEHDKKGFGRDYQSQIPRLMFLLMPVSALLLAVAYRSRRRRYPVHLIVALHLHAFVFALLALDEVRALIPWASVREPLKLAAVLWGCAYLPLALRRVYGGRLRYAALRTAVVLGEYTFVGAIAMAVMAVALILTY
jgi:hypothetical protein